MNKQPTRRRRASRAAARTLTVGAAVAALVTLLGAGQALAAVAPPDEHVLERQGRVNHQQSVAQADEQGKAKEPSQQKATEIPRRWIRPEPEMGPPPPFDDEQVAPAPARPARDQRGLVAAVAAAALLLAVGAAATWRIRHRRPQPESTQPELTQPELTQPESTA
jgi:hypothetical protein